MTLLGGGQKLVSSSKLFDGITQHSQVLSGYTGDGYGDRPKTWWTFFTNWTFVLFAVWSVLGIIVTAKHVQVRPHLGLILCAVWWHMYLCHCMTLQRCASGFSL